MELRRYLVAFFVVVLGNVSPHASTTQIGGLRIVVIEGEDAVNVIQLKSAVAPVVEVRDRNDQPVAGALVTFAIQKGRASFNGARNVTITTDATGRATATGLTPTGSGTVQIGASTAFQGQTAAAVIAQTNVMTLAQAASAGAGAASAGAGSAGAGAGGATGGGWSATTIGIVGAAAAGGTLVAVKAAGSNSDQNPAETPSAIVQIVASPNPVPFSGAPATGLCQGSPNTWFYDEIITETAGVAATLTASTNIQNGTITTEPSVNISIPAQGSITRSYSAGWCVSGPVQWVRQTNYRGTDANGHPITVTGPAVTLLAK